LTFDEHVNVFSESRGYGMRGNMKALGSLSAIYDAQNGDE